MTTGDILAAVARRELTPAQGADLMLAADAARHEAARPRWCPRWLWRAFAP